jgi:endo-1,3(4)-beta-glucanase
VVGESWSLVEHLHRTSFYAKNKPRPAMVPAIKKALKNDITYAPPRNYMEGAGDTYFSGKMLAKLARILILADEYDAVTKEEFATALDTLRRGVEIWYKPYAGSPLLYDRAWGGMVTCGCDYDYDKVDKRGYCRNAYPNCPALTDFGQNFGQGYYNDHHYHFGYHIYASAVVAKFNETWGRDYHQHVMLLVRDIVNPSDDDEFFPQWRHKDW